MKKDIFTLLILNTIAIICGVLAGIPLLSALCIGTISFLVGTTSGIMVEFTEFGVGSFLNNYILSFLYMAASLLWFYHSLPVIGIHAFLMYIPYTAFLIVTCLIVFNVSKDMWLKQWNR